MRPHAESWIRRALFPRENDSRSLYAEDRWITAGEDPPLDDRLWDQYAILTDLYKFYIDMIWKVSVGYYAAVGIALAYYFSNRNVPANEIRYLLSFIASVSLGLGYIQWYGARSMRSLAKWLEYIAYTLRIPGRPHVEFAMTYLLLGSGMSIIIAATCVALFTTSPH